VWWFVHGVSLNHAVIATVYRRLSVNYHITSPSDMTLCAIGHISLFWSRNPSFEVGSNVLKRWLAQEEIIYWIPYRRHLSNSKVFKIHSSAKICEISDFFRVMSNEFVRSTSQKHTFGNQSKQIFQSRHVQSISRWLSFHVLSMLTKVKKTWRALKRHEIWLPLSSHHRTT
jgi:hypothetical protein